MTKRKDFEVGRKFGPAAVVKPAPEYSLEWWIGDNVIFYMMVKKSLWNRWKWWIATRLFLPGNVKWIK